MHDIEAARKRVEDLCNAATLQAFGYCLGIIEGRNIIVMTNEESGMAWARLTEVVWAEAKTPFEGRPERETWLMSNGVTWHPLKQ